MDIDFADRSFIADPFPAYEEIRSAGRVVWNGALNVWMVSSFEDCKQVLSDRGTTFAEIKAAKFWFNAPTMISTDGTEHHRLRDCLRPLFTKKAVAKWEQRVGEVVDDLLTPLATGGESIDLISDFTKIPTVITAEMLGAPTARHEDIRRWSHVIVNGVAYGGETPEVRESMEQTASEMRRYLTEEIARHRCGHFDDILSLMLEMSEMSEDEMLCTAILLVNGGYDTTAKTITTALMTLEQHPDQRRMLAENPALMPAAIEEVIRWAGVVHVDPRVVVRPTELAGTALAPGDIVYSLLAAANRDSVRWRDPNRFDILRESKSHIGFGYGPHLCIGLWLGRLEARVALGRLLAVAPGYALRNVEYDTSYVVRGAAQGYIDAESIALPA